LNPFATDDEDIRPTEAAEPNADPLAERNLLASIWLDQSCLPLVEAVVPSGDAFHDSRHGVIYEAFRSIAKEGGEIEPSALATELHRVGKYNAVGGVHYVAGLTEECITSAHVESYAKTVAELARVRDALLAVNALHARRKERITLADVARVSQRLSSATLSTDARTVVPLEDSLQDAFTRLETTRRTGLPPGIKSGYVDVDRLVGLWRPGATYVIAARPAVGKTALTVCLAIGMSKTDPVLFQSLEMPHAELTDRALSATARIDSSLIRECRLSDGDMQDLAAAAERLSKRKLFIDDRSGLKLSQIRANCHRLANTTGLRVLIVDYLQLVKADGEKQSREQQVGEVSRGLKELAKEFQIPVIALAQMNREFEKRGKGQRPQLSDLRESGSIEQDADVVAFLHREEGAETAEFIVAKGRSVPTGTVQLRYQPEFTRFVNWSDTQ
jgi:replicative DNA helicase